MILCLLTHLELHLLPLRYLNQSFVACMREFADGPLPLFEDVAFRINARTVAMSPSCMCVVPLLNFSKCLKAYFLLKRVPRLSGPEVGSVLPVRMQEHVLKLYFLQFVQVRTCAN